MDKFKQAVNLTKKYLSENHPLGVLSWIVEVVPQKRDKVNVTFNIPEYFKGEFNVVTKTISINYKTGKVWGMFVHD